MGEEQHITTWTHQQLLDISGHKIGMVADVRYDDAGNKPKWLLVKSGLLGTHHMFVPASGVRASKDGLALSFTKDRVRHAPHVSDKEYLTGEEERMLDDYYGVEQ